MEKSCGILAYRQKNGVLQVLLGENGGFYNKNGWNIPKGHVEEGETDLECAEREFHEETSLPVPESPFIDLGTSKTSKGKIVRIFAASHDYNENGDDVEIRSNTVLVEYPKKSGKFIEVPELKRAKYINADKALECMYSYQKIFVENLMEILRCAQNR